MVEQQRELLLGERDVHDGERDGVKGEIPRREPRVLPLVRHGDDVVGDQVPPGFVPQARPAGQRVRTVLGQPPLHVERVVLLGPQHARERLLADEPLVVGKAAKQVVPELLGLPAADVKHIVEVAERVTALLRVGVVQPGPQGGGTPGRDVQHVVERGLGALAVWVDRRGVTAHDGTVDAVLHVRRVVG